MKKKRILLVTNSLSENEIAQICKAIDKKYSLFIRIAFSLVCVLPPVPMYYFDIPATNALIHQQYLEAQQILMNIGKQLRVAKKDQWLTSGKMHTEVLRLANQLGSSFILASSQQIHILRRSVLFDNVYRYLTINNIQSLEIL